MVAFKSTYIIIYELGALNQTSVEQMKFSYILQWNCLHPIGTSWVFAAYFKVSPFKSSLLLAKWLPISHYSSFDYFF